MIKLTTACGRVALLLALAGCGDEKSDQSFSDASVFSGGGEVTSGGSLVSGGGMMTGGGSGGANVGDTDAGMALPACPEYPHLPHDGEWVGEAIVLSSTCDEPLVGERVPQFETLSIEVLDLEPPSVFRKDIKVYDAQSNYYRGFVSDDSALPSGPLTPGVQGADLTTDFFINFAGNCLTANIYYASVPGTGASCGYRAYLYATRPNSMWK